MWHVDGRGTARVQYHNVEKIFPQELAKRLADQHISSELLLDRRGGQARMGNLLGDQEIRREPVY